MKYGNYMFLLSEKSTTLTTIIFANSVCVVSSGSAGDKKDAEASKIVTSPYNCTAEAIFGGRKSENIISPFEGIRKDSDIIPQIRLY